MSAKKERRYQGPLTVGYVVEKVDPAGSWGDGRPARELRAYWHGVKSPLPVVSWGTLDYSVAVFGSRPAAAKTFRAYAGERAGVRYRSLTAIHAELVEQGFTYEAREGSNLGLATWHRPDG